MKSGSSMASSSSAWLGGSIFTIILPRPLPFPLPFRDDAGMGGGACTIAIVVVAVGIVVGTMDHSPSTSSDMVLLPSICWIDKYSEAMVTLGVMMVVGAATLTHTPHAFIQNREPPMPCANKAVSRSGQVERHYSSARKPPGIHPSFTQGIPGEHRGNSSSMSCHLRTGPWGV
ncbi:hypothetical protein Pcinc_003392 [Petrolisthes cinctipes]|uniref:Uncharacterized protein n=1 Tax=Petrolisthes cinctipes TaxID=88211 RepID=A0AAE1GJI2_PETCI|nr:hypothetical protein Pcinc_003362 [Petrolisthes cinctipes]KAK3892804.1 hypothetical protein Pcinc_003392 [Petrolisthes cinctipes]